PEIHLYVVRALAVHRLFSLGAHGGLAWGASLQIVRFQLRSRGCELLGGESLLFPAPPLFLGARGTPHGDCSRRPELPYGACGGAGEGVFLHGTGATRRRGATRS